MIAFRARAVDDVVHADSDEIVDARWSDPAEMRQQLAATALHGRSDSIDSIVLGDLSSAPVTRSKPLRGGS